MTTSARCPRSMRRVATTSDVQPLGEYVPPPRVSRRTVPISRGAFASVRNNRRTSARWCPITTRANSSAWTCFARQRRRTAVIPCVGARDRTSMAILFASPIRGIPRCASIWVAPRKAGYASGRRPSSPTACSIRCATASDRRRAVRSAGART